MNYPNYPRSYVYDLMDSGMYTPTDIAIMCLKFMSNDDVLAMIKANEINPEFIGGEA
jgi:hypothetical protein